MEICVHLCSVLEAQVEPVRAGDDGAGQDQEDDQQDDPAPAAGAGHTPAKAELLLQPVEYPIQERQLEQARQTTRSIVHLYPPSTVLWGSERQGPSSPPRI